MRVFELHPIAKSWLSNQYTRMPLNQFRTHYYGQFVPIAVAAVLNIAILVGIAICNPDYLTDYRTGPNPDAIHYVLMGKNIFHHGAYSRSETAPFVPDIFRTPGYPIFAGLLDCLGGPLAIYIANIVLHLALCNLVYLTALTLFGRHSAGTASLFVAIHPTLLALNFQAMSEIPFIFLLSASTWLLIKTLTVETSISISLAAGILLGLAILVRPAGLYLPLIVGAFLVLSNKRRQFVAGLKNGGIFVLGVALCVGPWIIRNTVIFGYPVLTTNDTVVLVYFTGAGGYQVQHGVEHKTACAMIQKEFQIASPTQMWNYHKYGLSPVDMDRRARQAIIPVLSKYPLAVGTSGALAILKAVFSHDAGVWAQILNLQWHSPGIGKLLQLNSASWEILFANPPILIVAMIAPLVVNVLLVPLTLVGLIRGLRSGDARVFLVAGLFLFFTAVCGASGIDAYTRFSAAMLPFAAIFAGLSVASGVVKKFH